jgi:hypothetical protein
MVLTLPPFLIDLYGTLVLIRSRKPADAAGLCLYTNV